MAIQAAPKKNSKDAVKPVDSKPVEAKSAAVNETPVKEEIKMAKVVTKIVMVNPYTKVKAYPNDPVEVVYDSWWKGQVDDKVAELC